MRVAVFGVLFVLVSIPLCGEGFHGDLVANTSFPAAADDCQPLAKGARYLVTRNCRTGHCYVH